LNTQKINRFLAGYCRRNQLFIILDKLRGNSTLGSHDKGEFSEKLIGPDMVKGKIEVFDKVLDYLRQYVEAEN
jgi:hypothetical protein